MLGNQMPPFNEALLINCINEIEKRQFVGLVPLPPLYPRGQLSLPNFSALFYMMGFIIDEIRKAHQVLIEQCEIPICLGDGDKCKMIFTRKKEYVDQDNWRVTCDIESDSDESEELLSKLILEAYHTDKQKEDESSFTDWFEKRFSNDNKFQIYIQEIE